jgi:hypothetical protein
MKSIVAITLLVALVTINAKDHKNNPPAPTKPPTPKETEKPIEIKPIGPELKEVDPVPVFVFDGMRGLWSGIQHGLFKTKDSDQCLSDDVSAKIIKILTAISAGQMAELSSMIGDIMSIVGNLQKCNLNSFTEL